MAWNWSHTAEAYQNVLANLNKMDREKLETIYAEWEATTIRVTGQHILNDAKYEAAKVKAKQLPTDILADYIYEKSEEQALCTNGGHFAYVCPLTCHKVSFSPTDDKGDPIPGEGDND
jgi:hypothetical protein